jgi:hypothetical protein
MPNLWWKLAQITNVNNLLKQFLRPERNHDQN